MLAALSAKSKSLGQCSRILALWLAFFGLALLASGWPQWPLGVSLIMLALVALVGRKRNGAYLFLPTLAFIAVVVAVLLSAPHTDAELEATPPTFWPRFRVAFVFVALLIPLYLGSWFSLSASGNLSRVSQQLAAGFGLLVILESLLWLLPLPWIQPEYFFGFG